MMSKFSVKVVMRIGRSSGIVPLLFAVGGFGVGLSGCANRASSTEFSSSGSAAPAVNAAVPADVQANAQHQVESFLDNIQQKKFDLARKQMAPALRSKTPSDLNSWLKSGNYPALVGATGWKFDFQSSAGGKKLIVHSGFTGADQSSYRTNILLSRSGDSWQIDNILSPTKQVPPVSQKANTSAPPGH